MTQRHTPAPWHICETIMNGAITHWHIAGDKHGSVYPICCHTIEIEPCSEEQLANAKLIASAPILLEALEIAKGHIERLEGGVNDYDETDLMQLSSWSVFTRDKIDAAIAKARGSK